MPSKHCKKMASGFSLIELLVVVMVIALGIGFVSINIDAGKNYQMRIDAKQFANTTALMSEEAVLGNQQWGIDLFLTDELGFEQFGYRFLIRNDNNRWVEGSISQGDVEFLVAPELGLRLKLEGSDQEQEIEFKREIIEPDPDEIAITTNSSLVSEESSEVVESDIWLLSSGEITAFELEFFYQDTPDAVILVKGDELGRVKLVEEAEDDLLE